MTIFQQMRKSHKLDLAYRDVLKFEVEGVIFQEISSQEAERFIDFLYVFQEEVSKYPATFFENSDISKVIFVKKLFFNERPAQGVYRTPEGYMFFDIYRDFKNTIKQRHGIHHEIFHMIHASLYQRTGYDLKDWNLLNGPGFVYQNEGIWHQERNEFNFFAPSQKGFATSYGYSSKEEDMAEVYACLFIESQNRLIHLWAGKDDILRAKIARMKEVLAGFCPQVDQFFWKNLF